MRLANSATTPAGTSHSQGPRASRAGGNGFRLPPQKARKRIAEVDQHTHERKSARHVGDHPRLIIHDGQRCPFDRCAVAPAKTVIAALVEGLTAVAEWVVHPDAVVFQPCNLLAINQINARCIILGPCRPEIGFRMGVHEFNRVRFVKSAGTRIPRRYGLRRSLSRGGPAAEN